MIESYADGRRWSDGALPSLYAILAMLTCRPLESIRHTDPDTDLADGVDIQLGRMTIGARVRRWSALQRYGVQPTLRMHKNRYGHNEVRKIYLGKVRYMMLAYASEEASQAVSTSAELDRWLLIDLAPVTTALENGWDGCPPDYHDHGEHCRFVALDLDCLQARYGPMVVAAGGKADADGLFTVRMNLLEEARRLAVAA